MWTKIQAIIYNPKQRNIAILSILSLLLIILILVQIFSIEEKPPEGAFRAVICTKCNQVLSKRIKDINNKGDEGNLCEKCGEHLEIIWKCDECQFEYPESKREIKPKKNAKTMDIFQSVVESQRCPNCRSLSAHPMSINEIKKK